MVHWLTVLGCMVACSCFAQGTIYYEKQSAIALQETIDTSIANFRKNHTLTNDSMVEGSFWWMVEKQMIELHKNPPKFSYVLVFNPCQSLYVYQKSDNVFLGGGLLEVFTDITHKQQTMLYKADQNYLVQQEMPNFSWKILPDSIRKIGDFEAIKAIGKNYKDTTTIEAWYTPQIPISIGPAMYGGLPGLILEVHFSPTKGAKTGERILFAKYEPHIPTQLPIRPPDKGKVVTYEQWIEANQKFGEMMQSTKND